jgi:chorismate-pyruvate lyase
VTQKAPDRIVVDDDSLSEFQKILLTTDGTVTQLLEIHTGEKMRVVKLGHAVVEGGPHWLQVPGTEPVLSRRIVLRGGTRPWLYANSWLVLSRLPAGMQETLLHTDTPIGQLWRGARLETYREIVDFRRERDASIAGLFGSDAALLSRSYVIRSGGAVMGLIEEKFPMTHFAGNSAEAAGAGPQYVK